MPRIVVVSSLTLDGEPLLWQNSTLVTGDVPAADLDLVDSVTTTKGVVIAQYRVRGGTR